MTVKLPTKQNFEFLSLTGGFTGSSDSTLVKMPHCWKSHVVAQICGSKNKNARMRAWLVSLSHALKTLPLK